MTAEMKQHPIFTKDPSDWIQFVGTNVEIVTRDGGMHKGSVYTVDPVSGSIVLANSNPPTEQLNMKIILGHAIRSCTPLLTQGTSVNMDKLFKPKLPTDISSTELKLSQERLRSWFLKNRVPVVVCERDRSALVVADVLRIEAPYTAEDCISTNEIVLGRIQGLIKNMPVEENPNSCI